MLCLISLKYQDVTELPKLTVFGYVLVLQHGLEAVFSQRPEGQQCADS